MSKTLSADANAAAATDARLQRLLGGDALAALRQRLRRHFERTLAGAPPGVLRLGALSPREHAALAVLTGRPPHVASSMQIDLAGIDAAFQRSGIAPSLRAALEQLDGPIVHRATARAVAHSRWSLVAAGCLHAGLTTWLQIPSGLGLLKRLARQDADVAARLCERADAVLSQLPAAGLPRSQLAAQTLGDAHALDTGQPTATLVLAAWRQRRGSAGLDDPADAADTTDPADPAGPADPADPTDPAAPSAALPDTRARDVWASAGVLVNELARPALFLNLPVAHGQRLLATPGEPGYASLRRLLRLAPIWAVAGVDVHVCENPNLLAIAADRLGAQCAPLVCTEGMPAAAQRILLAQLVSAGGRLTYHGDFDWPGVHIANHVMRIHGAMPWRFDAAAYEAAVADAARPGHRLAGAPVAASWDAALAPAMQAHGLAIAEESLAADLLQDLRR